jgi:hypothetical protein
MLLLELILMGKRPKWEARTRQAKEYLKNKKEKTTKL